jgi:serine/threonine-protein kinase HipA
VVNTAVYDGFEQTLALSLGGRRVALEALTAADLVSFGLDIGIAERAVAQIFGDLAKRVRAAQPILVPPAAEGPEGFVSRFAEVVRGSCLRLLQI